MSAEESVRSSASSPRYEATPQAQFPGGAERRASVHLGWAGGTTARLTFRWAGRPAIDRLTCIGPGQVIRLPQLYSGWVIEQAAAAITSEVGSHGETRRFLPPEPNALIPVLRDFLRAVGSGGRPSCPLSDGVVIDNVIRAASGKGTNLP